MELNLALAIRRVLASMSIPTEWLTFKTATSMTTQLVMCACIFELSFELSSIARWNVTCAHDWQSGGGLYISGAATLTNTNVYSNAAPVCARLLIFP